MLTVRAENSEREREKRKIFLFVHLLPVLFYYFINQYKVNFYLKSISYFLQGQTVHRSEAIDKGDRQTDWQAGKQTNTHSI